MIRLDYPRERMLADIRADAAGARSFDLSDPASFADFVRSEEIHLRLRVRTPEEILARIGAALAARFAHVPPERLERNLLLPLKKALGNAHKRGNLRAPDKWITLELVVTPSGAFVEVSDEGAGFDVAGTFARFQGGARYFTHGGSGFRKFEKAEAIVSFADRGATIRICFVNEVAEAPPGLLLTEQLLGFTRRPSQSRPVVEYLPGLAGAAESALDQFAVL